MIRAQRKYMIVILVALSAAVAAALVWSYSGRMGSLIGLNLGGGSGSEASMACVANAFPVVVMEHGKFAIEKLLRELQAEGEDVGDLGEENLDQWVLSEEIDQRFLDLAGMVQNEDLSESEALGLQKHIQSELTALVALFKTQAPDYMKDCTALFHEIVGDCGDLDQESEENEQCMVKYQHKVAQLMSKHLDYNPQDL